MELNRLNEDRRNTEARSKLSMRKTITCFAEDQLIQAAQQSTSIENTTPEALSYEWLEQHVEHPFGAEKYDVVMLELSMIQVNRKFSRDEMNERR